MSALKINSLQIGQSLTAANNFTWYQPITPDGTVRLGVGNIGATTLDTVTVNSSGNVGIGTNSPVGQLNVNISTGGDLRITRTSTGGGSSTLGSVSFGNQSSSSLSSILATEGGATNSSILAFYTATGGSSSERMRIDSSGNVGIGTSSPSYRLDVTSASTGSKMFRFTSTGAGKYMYGYCDGGGTGITNSDPYSSGVMYYQSGSQHQFYTGSTQAMTLDASGNLSLGTTSTSGYKFLVQGTNADCARFVATSGRADLTLTSSGVISYDIGTNTDASFSIRQNGNYDFLRLYNNGNIGVGYAAGSSITTGTANIIIGRGAGQFVTSSNNNIVMGDYVTGTYYNYVSTVSSAKQTIIGDSISEIVYPTWTSFNGTYTIYDFALNSTTGGLYELSSVVNTNGGGSGYYRCLQHSYIGCNVNWGGNGYGVYLTSGSLYNHNGTNVNAIVIYNSNNSTEYVGSLYVSGSNYLWDTSGIYLRVKLTNFNTTPQYIGVQKVILRKKIIGN